MNSSKYELNKVNQKDKDILKNLPIIKKIVPVRTIFDPSSNSNRSISNVRSNIADFYHTKKQNIIPRDYIK